MNHKVLRVEEDCHRRQALARAFESSMAVTEGRA